MSWQPFTVIPPAEIVERQIGQLVKTVRVENPTAAYWYIPAAFTFVQPFTSGRVIRLPSGMETFTARFLAPPGVDEPTAAALANSPAASFILTDDDTPPDSGTLLGGESANREQVILSHTAGVITYVLPRPAPKGMRFALFYNAAIASPILGSVSASLLFPGIFGSYGMFNSIDYSIDNLQDNTFNWPFEVPAGAILSMVVPNDSKVLLRLTF